jgi:hypothetical protein
MLRRRSSPTRLRSRLLPSKSTLRLHQPAPLRYRVRRVNVRRAFPDVPGAASMQRYRYRGSAPGRSIPTSVRCARSRAETAFVLLPIDS